VGAGEGSRTGSTAGGTGAAGPAGTGLLGATSLLSGELIGVL
jgi:hypothetical protein